jgi:hypothetical protein
VEKVEGGTFREEHFLNRTFKLEEIGKAHEYCENNEAGGKVFCIVSAEVGAMPVNSTSIEDRGALR